jgi:hypothetical protein
MKQSQVLELERQQAAASIVWPKKTPVLMNPERAVRWKFYATLFGGIFFMTLVAFPNGAVDMVKQSIKNHQTRPAMESAMKAGNRAAGTWLATHYGKEYPGLLLTEASAGEPTAMYTLGRDLMQGANHGSDIAIDHPESGIKIDGAVTPAQLKGMGLDLVRKAAAAGNQDALLFALDNGGL